MDSQHISTDYNSPDEVFDVVDEADRVIGQAPRRIVHAKKLLHRAVHIFVFNTKGELLVHQRSSNKDEQPNVWSSSASGHLHTGEDYDVAASRELEEELGLVVPLKRVVKLPASEALCREHTVLYCCTTDIPPQPNPEEIQSIQFCPVAEWNARIAAHSEEFSTSFRELFAWWIANITP